MVRDGCRALVLAYGVALSGCGGAAPAEQAGAAKPQWATLAEPVSANSFARVDDRLYLADTRRGVVHRLVQRAPNGWAVEHTIGRRGSGPGEFQPPMAVAASSTARELLVLDRSARLQRFSAEGKLLHSTRVALPCQSGLNTLAVLGNTVYVAGRCHRIQQHESDTVYVVLWTLAPDGSLQARRWHALYTRDGGWGSVYGAVQPLVPAANALLFGAGVAPCIDYIEGTRQRSVCAKLPAYNAKPPPGFDADSRRRFGRGDRASRWPRPLPSYVGVISAGGRQAWVRPISAESVVVQQDHGSRVVTRLVAPLDSFVGCDRAGCLWVEPIASGTRLAFVPARVLVQ